MDADRHDAAARPLWRAPSFFAVTSFVGLAAAVLFAGFPAIDFAVSDLFFARERGAFIFNEPGIGEPVRVVFRFAFWGAVLLALAGLGAALFRHRRLLGLGFPHWLFVILCVIVGPGLVANTILKDNWGRARPLHIERYGGDQIYTPALVRSDQCERNCAFVSGEAAAVYGVVFAFAMLTARRRRELILAGWTAGTAIGLIRIGQGGHFISDVIFAGVFMALSVQALYWLVFGLGANALAEEGPVQSRMSQAGGAVAAATRTAVATARERTGPALRQAAARVTRSKPPSGGS